MYNVDRNLLLQIIFCFPLYTIQALSRLTSIIFNISFAVTSISFIFAGYVYAKNMQTIGPAIMSGVSVLVIIMIIGLCSLFIYKLCKVHTSSNTNSDKNISNVAIKLSLLAFISLSNVIITAISMAIKPILSSPHWDFIFTIVLNTDLFNNFLCIYLATDYIPQGLYIINYVVHVIILVINVGIYV